MIESIVDHMGHWKVLETPQIQETGGVIDLAKYIGFVYIITFDDGSRYIGAKKIWKRLTRPPVDFKRGPKKGFEQSDWRTYTSSSNVVNDKISEGVNPSEYLIVGFYDTWGKTLLAEASLQLQVNIFKRAEGHPVWLNYQIEGMFTPNCWDDSIASNNEYIVSKLSSGTIQSGVFWNDMCLDVQIEGEDVKDQPLFDLVPYNEYVKLLSGRIDEYNGISLSSEIKRKTWKFHVSDKYYDNQTDMLEGLGITKKELSLRNDVVENKTVETRTVYMKRLEKNPIQSKVIIRRYP